MTATIANAAILPILLSIFAISATVIYGPMLYAEITEVWTELDQEMKDFKDMTDVAYAGLADVVSRTDRLSRSAYGGMNGGSATVAGGSRPGGSPPGILPNGAGIPGCSKSYLCLFVLFN